MSMPTRIGTALASLAAVALVGACSPSGGASADAPTGSGSATTSGSGVLTRLGATEVLLLVGDQPTSTDLWTLDAAGVHQRRLEPRPKLFSMMTASKAGTIISAGGVGGANGADGLFEIRGETLSPLRLDGSRASAGAPSLSPDGRLLFIATEFGKDCGKPALGAMFSVYEASRVGAADSDRWSERRVQCTEKSYAPVVWGPGGQVAALVDSPADDDQVVLATEPGAAWRSLGRGSGATSLTWGSGPAPAVGAVVSDFHPAAAPAAPAVIGVVDGQREGLPTGWDPQGWLTDNTAMLVTKDATVGLWRPGGSEVEVLPVTVPQKIWDSAIVPRP